MLKAEALLLIFSCLFFILTSTIAQPCSTNSICNNGVCENGTCVCFSGYVTYKNSPCSYEQKQKLTAFLLSFFAGAFGADWFYLAGGNSGYLVAGSFKLISGLFFIVGVCFGCCTSICMLIDRPSVKKIGLCLSISIGILVIFCSLANAVWCTVDWIRVLTDSFKDGNGVSLKNW